MDACRLIVKVQLLAGALSAMLLTLACGGVTTVSPDSPQPAPTPIVTPAGQPTATTPTATTPTAVEDLCDPQSETHMASVAADLETLDASADPLAVLPRLQAIVATLDGLSLGPDALSTRDALAGAVSDLEAAADDPATRATAVAVAAQMLREMDATLCGPPQS